MAWVSKQLLNAFNYDNGVSPSEVLLPDSLLSGLAERERWTEKETLNSHIQENTLYAEKAKKRLAYLTRLEEEYTRNKRRLYVYNNLLSRMKENSNFTDKEAEDYANYYANRCYGDGEKIYFDSSIIAEIVTHIHSSKMCDSVDDYMSECCFTMALKKDVDLPTEITDTLPDTLGASLEDFERVHEESMAQGEMDSVEGIVEVVGGITESVKLLVDCSEKPVEKKTRPKTIIKANKKRKSTKKKSSAPKKASATKKASIVKVDSVTKKDSAPKGNSTTKKASTAKETSAAKKVSASKTASASKEISDTKEISTKKKDSAPKAASMTKTVYNTDNSITQESKRTASTQKNKKDCKVKEKGSTIMLNETKEIQDITTLSDEELYKKVCGLQKYDTVKKLTSKYKDVLATGAHVEDMMLGREKAGKVDYRLTASKSGSIRVCGVKNTGLYGLCCQYKEHVWVILEPMYLQVESVRLGSTVYIACMLPTDGDRKWVFTNLRTGQFSDVYYDWFSFSNAGNRTGQVFVAVDGDDRVGYVWHLVGKNFELGRKIGCKMFLNDPRFNKGRSHSEILENVTFKDPLDIKSVTINMKTYSMDDFFDFRAKKSFEKKEDVPVIFYNLHCDSKGLVSLESDAGFMEKLIKFDGMSEYLLMALTNFTNSVYNVEEKVVRKKTSLDYVYRKLSVNCGLELKNLFKKFLTMGNSEALGRYWLGRGFTTPTEALDDITISNFKNFYIGIDKRNFCAKIAVLKYIGGDVYTVLLTTCGGKSVRLHFTKLLEAGKAVTNSTNSKLLEEHFSAITQECTMLDIKEFKECKKRLNVLTKAPLDVVATQGKLAVKVSSFREVTEGILTVLLAGIDVGLEVVVSDWLDFKSHNLELKRTVNNGEERDIEEVRKYAQDYEKLMSAPTPVYSSSTSVFTLELK